LQEKKEIRNRESRCAREHPTDLTKKKKRVLSAEVAYKNTPPLSREKRGPAREKEKKRARAVRKMKKGRSMQELREQRG